MRTIIAYIILTIGIIITLTTHSPIALIFFGSCGTLFIENLLTISNKTKH